MKTTICIAVILFASTVFSQDHGFMAKFPPISVTGGLTADLFKHADAVILLKQQGYTEGPHSYADAFTIVIRNEFVVESKVIIAKVFNDAGVREFGSFEYEYPVYEGIEQIFKVRARIMKPDSTIWVMPDDAITRMAGLTSGSGKTLTQKVLFKLANLTPGDVVQIEYTHTKPYLDTRKVIFYYHDQYPVLNSTLTINMDAAVKVDYLSFPADKVGEPQVDRKGNNISHFWAVGNLSEIPKEPFNRPFADVSYITTVVSHHKGSAEDGWRELAKKYISHFVDKGSIPDSFVKKIGLDPALQSPRWTDIDSAYTALRKHFTLQSTNSLYPGVRILDDIIADKEGDASDLAYMMLKIMERWGVPATPLLIRDKRDGIYETSVASLFWFDRLSLLVSLQGVDRIFDFDRSIPTRFEMPWFLNGISVVALHDTGVAHLYVSALSSLQDHTSKEFHSVVLVSNKKAVDSVCLRLRGARAEDLRSKLYAVKGEALVNRERELMEANVLKDVDTTFISNFLDESEILVYGKGTSQGTVMTVDSFSTYRPRNQLLREFRNRFSEDMRYDDIFLNEPFGCSIQWIVKSMAGSSVAQLPAAFTAEDSAFATSQTMYFQVNDSTCFVRTDIVFTAARIEQKNYRRFVAFLDKIIQASEREVAFRKR